MGRAGYALGAALIALLVASASVASAQDAEEDRRQTAAARSLFEEGVAFFDRGELEEAEDRFRRSLAIRRSPSVMFNLATALVRRGQLVEAHELYQEVAAHATSERLRREARARAAEVAPRMARLTVHVRGGTADAIVRVDSLVLSPAMRGVPIPVDPGTRRVTAEVRGERLVEREVQLEEGAERSIEIELPVATPEEAAAAIAGSTPAPIEPVPRNVGGSSDVTREWWLWTVVAVGVAALAIGGVILGLELDGGRYFSGNGGRIDLR